MVRWFRDKKGYKRFSDSGKPVHRHVAERKLEESYVKEKLSITLTGINQIIEEKTSGFLKVKNNTIKHTKEIKNAMEDGELY